MTPENNYSINLALESSQPDQRLLSKQVELLSQNIGVALLGSAVCLFFMVNILADSYPPSELLTWALTGGIILLARYGYHLFYRRYPTDQLNKTAWLRTQYLGTFLSGSVWGYVGIYLIPDHALSLAIMIILLGGIAAASTATFAPVRGLSATLIIPLVAPFSLNMMLQGEKLHLTIGITTFLFMFIMLVTGERLHRAIMHSLRMGFENQDMAHISTKARERTQQLNNELRIEIENRKKTETKIEDSEHELSRILENMQDTYYRTDLDGSLVRVSASVETLLGYTPEELIGTRLANLYRQAEDREKFLAALKKSPGQVKNYTAPFRRKDDTIIWVSTNAHYLHDDNGAIVGVEGTTRDITGLKEAERALFEEKVKAEVTLRSIGDGVITTDIEGKIDFMNPVAEDLTGWTRGKGHGKFLPEIVTLTSEASGEVLDDIFSNCCSPYNKPETLDGDLVMRNRRTNQEYSVEITVSDLKDNQGNCRGSVMVFHDVTKLRGMARKMSYQATHDSLTGLINRAEFERRLESAIQETGEDTQIQHALMYLDLDQFKVVNDTSGHIAGDELLRQLTDELRSRVRGNDVLARLGGDEFGVLLQSCPIEKAQIVAEELRDIAQRFRFLWEGKVFEIGVSIGLVPINTESGDIASLLSAADSACYVAKDLGRNRVHIFDNDDEEVALRHGQMQWIQRIKHALEEDRFTLYSQVVHPIRQGDKSGFYREILVRLIDEKGGLVSPAAFIPAAERYDLMPAIDRWVVKAALDHFSTKEQLAPNDMLAINLSGQSLADEHFLDFMVDQIQSSGINAQQVCLEITETAAISNQSRASEFMTALKQMGCRFALDDFGSGLSSFGYLKRMPVDYLKIDGEFIRDIHNDPIHYAMVESINHIGHVFGMQTIAEFVENDEILAALNEMGVDYAQGYGVARPEPLCKEDQSA